MCCDNNRRLWRGEVQDNQFEGAEDQTRIVKQEVIEEQYQESVEDQGDNPDLDEEQMEPMSTSEDYDPLVVSVALN